MTKDEKAQIVRDTMSALIDELCSQDQKWGEHRIHPLRPAEMHIDDYRNYTLMIPSEKQAKINCDGSFKNGRGSWMHILIEEIAEAAEAVNSIDQYKELIQVAAVAIQAASSVAIQRIEKAKGNRLVS